MSSRGERNNNPGNLEASAWTKSQPGYVGSDGRFAQFATMADGIAAQVKLLTNSYINKGYDTVAAIINRYGNDPGTADDKSVKNYINYVSDRLNVSPDSKLSQSMANGLAAAMREFETGNTKATSGDAANSDTSWYDTLTDPVGTATSAIGDWFSTGIVARIAYVVIGIILIGLAIAAFVFLSDNKPKIALEV